MGSSQNPSLMCECMAWDKVCAYCNIITNSFLHWFIRCILALGAHICTAY